MVQAMLPESDPLDPSPLIRPTLDPRDYEFRLLKALAPLVVLLLCLGLWAGIWWTAIALVDAIR